MHLTGGTPRFVTVPLSLLPGPLRFITRMLRLITCMLRLIARLLHRFPARPRSFTLRLPHGVANIRIEVHVAHVNMEVLHLVVKGLHLLIEVFGVEVEAEVALVLANFLLPELHRDFLLCVLSQDSQGNVCPVSLATNELRELIRIHKNLVVKHLENVIRLNSRSRGRAIRHDVIDYETEASLQP